MNIRLLTLVSVLLVSVANAQLTKILDFEAIEKGSSPRGELVSDGTFLYGMTEYGGTYAKGTIFRIMPDGTNFTKMYDFGSGENGTYPRGSFFYDGTFLYGMTSLGGTSNLGTIFKIKPNGTEYIKIYDFLSIPDGGKPWGSLVSDGTFLYGMTSGGGSYSVDNCDPGTIFKIRPDGTSYERIFDFDGFLNGSSPSGSLFLQGAYLYGMTSFGGSNNKGIIFKIMTNGTGFLKLFDFDGVTTGAVPCGSLFSDGTFLYGMTKSGGSNQDGVIFKIKIDGTEYTKLLNFDVSVNGKAPNGSLILEGSFLYGNTSIGANYGAGTIFRVKPNGTEYSNLHNFVSMDGSSPKGSFYSAGDILYCMTSDGGLNSCGSIIKYDLNSVGINDNFTDSEVIVFPNPTSGTLNITLIESAADSSNDGVYFLINELGQTMVSFTLNTSKNKIINIENLCNGVYFIVGSGSRLQKIVVSK